MEDAGQRERMGQPVGFLDVLDPGAWPGCVDRPGYPGTMGLWWDGAEKDQHTAGPHSLRCQCGQDTGASGAQPQVGARVWVLHRGALEGRWMWGCHHPRPLRRPYVCYKRKHWTGWDRSAGLWTCRWAAASGWAGRVCPRPEACLRPRSASHPQVWASLCSARSRVSTAQKG